MHKIIILLEILKGLNKYKLIIAIKKIQTKIHNVILTNFL